jgi:hypothetical protein
VLSDLEERELFDVYEPSFQADPDPRRHEGDLYEVYDAELQTVAYCRDEKVARFLADLLERAWEDFEREMEDTGVG